LNEVRRCTFTIVENQELNRSGRGPIQPGQRIQMVGGAKKVVDPAGSEL